MVNEVEGITVYTNSANLRKVKKYLEEKGVAIESAEVEYVAKEKIEVMVINISKDKQTKMIEFDLSNGYCINKYYHK